MHHLKYLAGYSPQITAQVAELVAENRLGSVIESPEGPSTGGNAMREWQSLAHVKNQAPAGFLAGAFFVVSNCATSHANAILMKDQTKV